MDAFVDYQAMIATQAVLESRVFAYEHDDLDVVEEKTLAANENFWTLLMQQHKDANKVRDIMNQVYAPLGVVVRLLDDNGLEVDPRYEDFDIVLELLHTDYRYTFTEQ